MPRTLNVVRNDEVGQHNSLWPRWEFGHLVSPLVGTHTLLTVGSVGDASNINLARKGPRKSPRDVGSQLTERCPRRVLYGQFLKAGERGIEVCLVEDFEPGDHVAFKCEKGDFAPLGVEALL